MTPIEIDEKRHAFETHLKDLIDEFESDTGTMVEDIEIHTQWAGLMSQKHKSRQSLAVVCCIQIPRVVG